MRYSLDAEVNGFCGPRISVALVPEDVNFAPFFEAIVAPLGRAVSMGSGRRARLYQCSACAAIRTRRSSIAYCCDDLTPTGSRSLLDFGYVLEKRWHTDP